MAELTVPLSVFKDSFSDRIIFESAEIVACSVGAILVKAEKNTPTRIFADSIPLARISYSGIAGMDQTPVHGDGRRRKRK